MCWEGADLTGSPRSSPMGGRLKAERRESISAVTWHLEVGKVVTRTVLRAVSEFMIYYKYCKRSL